MFLLCAFGSYLAIVHDVCSNCRFVGITEAFKADTSDKKINLGMSLPLLLSASLAPRRVTIELLLFANPTCTET